MSFVRLKKRLAIIPNPLSWEAPEVKKELESVQKNLLVAINRMPFPPKKEIQFLSLGNSLYRAWPDTISPRHIQFSGNNYDSNGDLKFELNADTAKKLKKPDRFHQKSKEVIDIFCDHNKSFVIADHTETGRGIRSWLDLANFVLKRNHDTFNGENPATKITLTCLLFTTEGIPPLMSDESLSKLEMLSINVINIPATADEKIWVFDNDVDRQLPSFKVFEK